MDFETIRESFRMPPKKIWKTVGRRSAQLECEDLQTSHEHLEPAVIDTFVLFLPSPTHTNEMLRLYEQTKPEEQQVAAAIKKRNRTKFRWGTSSKSSSSTNSTKSSASTSKSSTPAASNKPSPPDPQPKARRSSLFRRPARLQPTLTPIIESDLEAHESDDEAQRPLSPTSSSFSSSAATCSLPTDSPSSRGSSSASFTLPSSAQSTDTNTDADAFKPRVEYNLRKLLRQVMGLDGLWTSDQQVTRHYARIHWRVVKTQADGNCLFRAISDQLYGSEAFHGDIRRRIADFIQREGTLFQPFLATDEASGESLQQYCVRMRREGEWGGNMELYAAAKLFNIHVVIHQGPMRRVRIENGREDDPKTGKPPKPYKILHLLFKSDHYSSLRPPPIKEKSEPTPTVMNESHRSRYNRAMALLDKVSASKHDELRVQEFVAAVVAKRNRSPEASPQHSRRQAKAHRAQDDTTSEPVKQEERPAQADDKRPKQPEPSVKIAGSLGLELMPAFEEAEVRMSKPTRVTFRRGKAHSVCSSSDGESEPSSPSPAPECPPRRKQSTEAPVPSPRLFATKSMHMLLLDTEDGPELRAEDEFQSSTLVVLPSRLKFHRGVQQQQLTATAY